ncbi:MAG: tetratricopeptide repeat protein [Terracidiphilus sp.]|nr:tetratricopeptide repeat protein [Terracidiphilus sp.]MDR3776865.1 tetratricopeptide repeat protein [Terracidiphilus sp.]
MISELWSGKKPLSGVCDSQRKSAQGGSAKGLSVFLVACLLGAALLAGRGVKAVRAAYEPERITIDYPLNQSVFPPDMAAPTFLWRDPASSAAAWQIDVAFANGSKELHIAAKGERMTVGEIDTRCISNTNKLPELTPEQAAAHTWKPDADTWAAIKKQAGTGAVTIALRGYAADNQSQPVSRGSMELHISADPVGAPIFYRDVPLMPSELEKGFIKPLATSAIPLIAWRMRNVADASSHIVMTDLHTCANCHSFAGNGKTMGMDMDGPQNDKGLYTLAAVQPKMTIRNEDMISWSSFPTESGSPVRVGFMSQVSPDGRHVVTTINPPGAKSSQFYYVANFKDYRFLQVFYPTRGILVWYDRETKKLQPLPGADDPHFVQASAVWSPDGKYLVFARAEAKDSYPEDGKMAAYANDPAEVPIKYDLYRIPFNDGKGGKAEPIEGASHNGMSNSFAKISPDGKWMVFVQAKNGQLMRPDSQLYIVPAAGGKARRMNCNTSLMNSWHSFSPNGRWMVFSSKSRSPYTQMYLTHIDAEGNDSPAILIENSTAANRAVNIPEFVNMAPSGVEHIDTPAVDFYKQYDVAADLAKKGQYGAAIPEWLKAVAMSPGDARVHNNFGQTLSHAGKTEEAIEEYQKSIAARPNYPEAHNNLAIALAGAGKGNEAIEHYRLALEQNPGYAEAHSNLGRALAEQGRLNDAIEQYEEAISIKPEYAEAHNNLGFALTAEGRLDEAVGHYRQAIESDPKYAHAYNNLGLALAMQGKLDEALGDFSKAVELDPAYASAEANLGHALLEKNRVDEAIEHLKKALELGPETAEVHDNLGVGLAQKGRIAEAVPHFERALELAPNLAEAHYYLGMTLVMRGQGAEGLKHWRQALKKDPDNAQTLNDTAWLLATSPDAALRNGSEAVALAQHAAQLTKGRAPEILGTLAAAYAEAGAFDKALETEQQAVDLATRQGNTRLAEELGRRRELFEAKTAIRQR